MKLYLTLAILAAAGASSAFAQLNESIRKDIEANKPLPEVIAKAQAVAMESVKKTGTIEKTDPQLQKKPQTSQSLNEELKNIETTWNAAGFSVRWNEGLIVQAVEPNSPADKAGIRPGQRIGSIGSTQMGGMGDFVMRASGQSKGPVKMYLPDPPDKGEVKGGREVELELVPPAEQKPPKERLEFRAVDTSEVKKPAPEAQKPDKEKVKKAAPVKS